MYLFLSFESSKNIVCIHCNHGKGRTGTLIISYLLFNRIFNQVGQAKIFYEKKRFLSDSNLKISQPCQLRYLAYVDSISKGKMQNKLKSFYLNKITVRNWIRNKIFKLRMISLRSHQVIFESQWLSDQGQQNTLLFKDYSIKLIADFYLQIIKKSLVKEKKFAKLSLNSNFLSLGANQYKIKDFSPDSLDHSKFKNFYINLTVREDLKACKKCEQPNQQLQSNLWVNSIQRIKQSRKLQTSKQEIVFGRIKLS